MFLISWDIRAISNIQHKAGLEDINKRRWKHGTNDIQNDHLEKIRVKDIFSKEKDQSVSEFTCSHVSKVVGAQVLKEQTAIHFTKTSNYGRMLNHSI